MPEHAVSAAPMGGKRPRTQLAFSESRSSLGGAEYGTTTLSHPHRRLSAYRERTVVRAAWLRELGTFIVPRIHEHGVRRALSDMIDVGS